MLSNDVDNLVSPKRKLKKKYSHLITWREYKIGIYFKAKTEISYQSRMKRKETKEQTIKNRVKIKH